MSPAIVVAALTPQRLVVLAEDLFGCGVVASVAQQRGQYAEPIAASQVRKGPFGAEPDIFIVQHDPQHIAHHCQRGMSRKHDIAHDAAHGRELLGRSERARIAGGLRLELDH